MGSAPRSGMTIVFIRSLNATPSATPTASPPIQLRGRTRPISRHGVRESRAQTRTRTAASGGVRAAPPRITRVARIPGGPNPLRPAAKRSPDAGADSRGGAGVSLSPVLALPGIRHLQEQRAIGPDEGVGLVDQAVVAITEEKHRLPVQTVAVEHRAQEAAVTIGHRERVQPRVPLGGDELPDRPYERARVHDVDGLEAPDERGVEARIARIQVEPLARDGGGQGQMNERAHRGGERNVGPLPHLAVIEVDEVAHSSLQGDSRQPASRVELKEVGQELLGLELGAHGNLVDVQLDLAIQVVPAEEEDAGEVIVAEIIAAGEVEPVTHPVDADEVEQSGRVEPPPGPHVPLPESHLGHEAVVAAKVLAVVVVTETQVV